MESVRVTAFLIADVMREAVCSQRCSSGRLPPHVVGRAHPHGTVVRGGGVDVDLGVTGDLLRHSLGPQRDNARSQSHGSARLNSPRIECCFLFFVDSYLFLYVCWYFFPIIIIMNTIFINIVYIITLCYNYSIKLYIIIMIIMIIIMVVFSWRKSSTNINRMALQYKHFPIITN